MGVHGLLAPLKAFGYVMFVLFVICLGVLALVFLVRFFLFVL